MNQLARTTGLIALATVFAPNCAHALDYRVDALDIPTGYSSTAYAINNLGQVVGSMAAPGSGPGNVLDQAVIWTDGNPTILSSSRGAAYALNDSSQVVGVSWSPGDQYVQPTLWTGNVALPLSTPPGFATGPHAINSSGLIVGGYSPSTSTQSAIVWNGSSETLLNSLGGPETAALAVNASGEIAGYSSIPSLISSPRHAVVWNNNTLTDLGTFADSINGDSAATSINNAGDVVGSSTTATYANHAALWHNGNVIDLGTLGGSYSAAWSINNLGQVVGASTLASGSQHGTLWDGMSIIDLNTFLSAADANAGWVVDSAYGINDKGSIVVFEINAQLGLTRGAVLTAVPEPSTAALWGVSVAALIAGVSRKKIARSVPCDGKCCSRYQ